MGGSFKANFQHHPEGTDQWYPVVGGETLLSVHPWSSETGSQVRLLFSICPSSLTSDVRNIMQSHIQSCADNAARHIGFLLEEEKEPFTMSARYYSKYRSEFLGHYKTARLRSKSSVIKNLEDNNNPNMKVAINEAISALAKIGLRSIDASSLAALLPPDPMEPAIGIMADVRAYFQG